MSSNNYRILLHFLNQLDSSLRIGLRLRNRSVDDLLFKNFFNDIRRDINHRCRDSNRNVTKSLFRPLSTRNGKIRSNRLNSAEVVDRSYMIYEGVRQYMQYIAKHNMKSSVLSPFSSSLEVEIPIQRQDNKHTNDGDNYDINFKTHRKTHEIPVENQTFNENITKSSAVNESLAKSITSDENVLNGVNDVNTKIITNKSIGNITSRPNNNLQQTLSQKSKERKVPANRVSRMASFGSLAIGLGFGALEELTKKTLGFTSSANNEKTILGSNPLLTEANANRIVDTLCRVRGAALKLGQMLSIQDNNLISPELQKIFERVRQSADFMPIKQMRKVLKEELGDDWQTKFKSFDEKPFAAASIGQVHRATLHNGLEVAVKIQYPGVADGIESDIRNLLSILKFGNFLPEGLFVENIMQYARKELSWEVDYVREALMQRKYKEILTTHLNTEGFYVPKVIEELSTKKVFTSELISGISVDRLETTDSVPQEVKSRIARQLMKLCLREIFEFKFMQTDPNWSNFYYDMNTGVINLLDFGSTRDFSKEFVNKYMDVIKASADQDRERVVECSKTIGFLTGYETQVFERTHTNAIMILGEAFSTEGEFDFGDQKLTKRIHDLMPVLLKYRLTPPPEEIYSLHRKISGLFMLSSKLRAKFKCKEIFDDIYNNYEY
ncbi:atypical kinase COQ8B, mitochondrial-like [Oppia nitens]|uniref:atypical kinase COQ8B, mitochondrial-like n=1 Tax=Oppia nitens TaxID=1686743 RepID=UPI0023DA8513|nr:atypical kinase COQ8B, mitochondrial-like [Oppia nitens]